jgi:glycosyltransferase involved in cell wall biosynthesis
VKIALVVHGRFHAFDLGRELLRLGHDVTVFTNYPRWAAARFGLPQQRVEAFWPHGLLSRGNARLRLPDGASVREAWLHQLFGHWAARSLARGRWDIVHIWSGVAEETLRRRAAGRATTWLMRGSAHIRAQARLLAEEAARTGAPQDAPSPWMIAREEREYELADAVVTLSTFAFNSFLSEGVPGERLRLLPLGAQLSAFRPSPETAEARRRRILSGAPLRVLYVGALSFQKGLWDLASVIEELGDHGYTFRLVGPRPSETAPLLRRFAGRAILTPSQPQAALPEVYAWGDVFVYPTIQDGYAMVLAQAAAAGLPILATANCCAPDLVRPSETGWIVPIRSADQLVERLRWCTVHRAELASMSQRLYAEFQPRDWAAVASDFVALSGRPRALSLVGQRT